MHEHIRHILNDVSEQLNTQETTANTLPDKYLPIPKSEDKQAVFFDGGQATILAGASYLVGLIRTGAVIYDNKLIRQDRKEYYVVIRSTGKDYITVITYPASELSGKLILTFSVGGDEQPLIQACGMIRRRAELLHAQAISKEVNNSIIVLDGSLETMMPEETTLMNSLSDICKENNNSLVGFVKTCSWQHNGTALTAIMDKNGKQKPWLYKWTTQEITTYFVKLHPSARHVFRIDLATDDPNIMHTLEKYSTDPTFYGYPYPLVYVDKIARVSFQEARAQQLRFASEAGKLWHDIKQDLATQDSHSALDELNSQK